MESSIALLLILPSGLRSLFQAAVFVDHAVELFGVARPGVALEIHIQRDNVVQPVGRQVERIARPHNDFVGFSESKVWVTEIVRLGPIDLTVALGGVAGGVHVQVAALVRMVEDPAADSSEGDGVVATCIEMALRDDTEEGQGGRGGGGREGGDTYSSQTDNGCPLARQGRP